MNEMTAPAPTILAFDTSGSYCAAALMRGGKIVATRVEEMKRGQAEALFPFLESILRDSELSWSNLDRIGVGVGPGNFTGIRISVASARGLALSLGIPALGVSTLEVQHLNNPVLAQVPAPRDQSYIQAFLDTVGEARLVTNDNAEAEANELGIPLGAPLPPAQLVEEIATRASKAEDISKPAPLYVRAADAAPPRDPAPIILP